MQTFSTNRPVVFVTPTFPAFHGNGLAMRAAATLRLLSAWSSEVHLLVIPIYTEGQLSPEPEIAQMCRSWRMVSNPDLSARTAPLSEWFEALSERDAIPREWRHYNTAWQNEVTATIEKCHPGLIVVFRFYLAPFIYESVGAAVPVWLDLDELESTARARLSHIYGVAGKQQEAFDLRMEALAYESLEKHHLKSFERIFASSKIEAERALSRCPGAKTYLLPNIYPADLPQSRREVGGTARLLYVGSFGYYPNQDAVDYFCKDVLPRIRARSPVPVELSVIGSGQPVTGEHPSMVGVHFIGAVPQTTAYYADCDAVIVPLRAAGGTRIKVLEAFSHHRAVVATSIGAEGLEVTAGVHLHIADGPEDFSADCLRLIENESERHELAEQGHAFFLSHHTLQALESMIPQMFGKTSAPA